MCSWEMLYFAYLTSFQKMTSAGINSLQHKNAKILRDISWFYPEFFFSKHENKAEL